jgi:hypothetical protein
VTAAPPRTPAHRCFFDYRPLQVAATIRTDCTSSICPPMDDALPERVSCALPLCPVPDVLPVDVLPPVVLPPVVLPPAVLPEVRPPVVLPPAVLPEVLPPDVLPPDVLPGMFCDAIRPVTSTWWPTWLRSSLVLPVSV